MSSKARVIETQEVTKYYGKTRGIEDVSLVIEQGEIFGFLGPNGAGKTTTIRLLLNLIFPTRGQIKIFGQDISVNPFSIREEIGYIPDDVRLYPKMTGGYLLNYFARFKPSKPARLKTELVERFDLDLARKVGEYSRGNRQKLAIILALMHDPKLLILDEPTLALDPLMQREFYKVLQEFRDRGATVFLSSHILPEVEKICDRVGIIRDGRLIAVESVEALVKKKIYHIEASFADEVKASQLKIPGVVQVDQENHIFHLTFKGDLNRLLSSLNQYQILDLTINHARLEEIFFEFYQ